MTANSQTCCAIAYRRETFNHHSSLDYLDDSFSHLFACLVDTSAKFYIMCNMKEESEMVEQYITDKTDENLRNIFRASLET